MVSPVRARSLSLSQLACFSTQAKPAQTRYEGVMNSQQTRESLSLDRGQLSPALPSMELQAGFVMCLLIFQKAEARNFIENFPHSMLEVISLFLKQCFRNKV